MSRSAIMRWADRAMMNAAWLSLTLMCAAFTYHLWPAPSWGWGLLLGSGIGGSTVMLLAYARLRVRQQSTEVEGNGV